MGNACENCRWFISVSLQTYPHLETTAKEGLTSFQSHPSVVALWNTRVEPNYCRWMAWVIWLAHGDEVFTQWTGEPFVITISISEFVTYCTVWQFYKCFKWGGHSGRSHGCWWAQSNYRKLIKVITVSLAWCFLNIPHFTSKLRFWLDVFLPNGLKGSSRLL